MDVTEERKKKRILKEYDVCKRLEKDWDSDDGVLFKCKRCRRYLPQHMKSENKKGQCKSCMGE